MTHGLPSPAVSTNSSFYVFCVVSLIKLFNKQYSFWFQLLLVMIWDAMIPMWCHCNGFKTTYVILDIDITTRLKQHLYNLLFPLGRNMDCATVMLKKKTPLFFTQVHHENTNRKDDLLARIGQASSVSFYVLQKLNQSIPIKKKVLKIKIDNFGKSKNLYQKSGTKQKLVAKILATNNGNRFSMGWPMNQFRLHSRIKMVPRNLNMNQQD